MTNRAQRPTGWRPGHTYTLIICLTLIAITIIGKGLAMPRPSRNPFDIRDNTTWTLPGEDPIGVASLATEDLVTFIYAAAVGDAAKYVDSATEANSRKFIDREVAPYVARIKLEAIREYQAKAGI